MDFEKFMELANNGGASAPKGAGGSADVDMVDYDAPENFNDFFENGINVSLDREASAFQTHQAMVRRLNIPDGPVEQQKEQISNILEPGKTIDDVLSSTSKFWEMRLQSSAMYETMMARQAVDNSLYPALYRAYRKERIEASYNARADSQYDDRLPDSIKLSRQWYDKQKNQFLLFPTVYQNLTYFGNIITHMANDFTVVANPGQNFETMFLIRITCLAAPQFNIAQSLYVLLAGDASTGKSHMMLKNRDMLPDGWTLHMSHMSTMALSSDENEDFIVLMIEETPVTMTEETAARTGADNGASFLKTLLTNKIVTTRTVAYDKGQRPRVVHVTSKMMTAVFATNNPLNASSPLLKRYLVVKPNHDPLISQKRQKIDACDMSEEEKNAQNREKILAHLVQMAEWMIGTGAIRQPDMSILPICLNRVIEEMGRRGHVMVDAKSVNMVQQVVRTLVVMRAVCESCLSEMYSELRVAPDGRHKKFEEHYLEHFIHIDERLVAQEPECYFGISLCAGIFGDDTEGKLIEAARRMLGVTVKKGELHFANHNPPFLYNRAEQKPGTDARVLVPETHHAELMPPEGRGKEQLINALCSQFAERPSANNMRRALENLMKKGLEHDVMRIREEKGKCIVYADEAAGKGCSSIIRPMLLKDNHEEVLLDASKATKSTKENTRYYFCLPTLFNYTSQSDAMTEAIEALQHRFTDEQTHIISIPLIANRLNLPFAKKKQPFHGIFKTIDFKPNPKNLLSFMSHHTLYGAQVQTLSRASMLDGGDNTLRNIPKNELELRKQANSRRSLVIQTPGFVVNGRLDMASYMSRYQACASTMKNPDLLHWLNFTRHCLQLRAAMPNRFGPIDLGIYPDKLLLQAQEKNKLDDLLRDEHTSVDKKLELLPSFGSHVSSTSTGLVPPSEEMIIRTMVSGGIEHVRGMFCQIDNRMWTAPSLDESSRKLLEKLPDGQSNWKTICNIMTLYQTPVETAKLFMKYAGLNLSIAAPTPTCARSVASITIGEPIRQLTYRPLTITERISKKRQREAERTENEGAFDAGNDLALVPANAARKPASTVDDNDDFGNVLKTIDQQKDATYFESSLLNIQSTDGVDSALQESVRLEEEKKKKQKLTEQQQTHNADASARNASNNDDDNDNNDNVGTQTKAQPSYSANFDPFKQTFRFDYAR